jgi:hypothetical protein
LTLLIVLKLDDLFNDAAMLDEAHNTAVAIFETYNRLRAELNAIVTPVGFTGDVAHFEVTPEQFRIARPKMIECNQLIEAMRDQADRGAKQSWALLTAVAAAFNEKLQLKLEVSQPVVPDFPERL